MYFYVFVIEHFIKMKFESVFESVCAPAQFLSCRFRCNQAEEQTILPFLHLCNKLPCRVLSSRKWQIPPEPLQKTPLHCTLFCQGVSRWSHKPRRCCQLSAAVSPSRYRWAEGPQSLRARRSQSCHSHDDRMRQAKVAVQQTVKWALGGVHTSSAQHSSSCYACIWECNDTSWRLTATTLLIRCIFTACWLVLILWGK